MSDGDEASGERRAVFSQWRTIVALGLLGMVLGFGWGISDQPQFPATATVAVESDSQGSDAARLERFAQRGQSREVAIVAAGILGGDIPGADLLADITVQPAVDGGAIVVTATSESPDLSAAAAEAFAEALVEVEGDPLALGAAAAIPSAVTENRPAALWAGIGSVVGVLLGLAIAAVRSSRLSGSGR